VNEKGWFDENSNRNGKKMDENKEQMKRTAE
jgi:hypothetical protein